MTTHELALEVATKVADGEPVDWIDLENRLAPPIPLGPFRALEAIARTYRALLATLSGSHVATGRCG